MSKVIQILMSKSGMLTALRDDGTIWNQQYDYQEGAGDLQQFKWTETRGPDGLSREQEDELEVEKRLKDSEDRLAKQMEQEVRAGRTVLVKGHDLGGLTWDSPDPEAFNPNRYRK